MRTTCEKWAGQIAQAHGWSGKHRTCGAGSAWDKQALLERAAHRAEQGCLCQAAKAMNGYFRLIKCPQSATRVADLAIGVFLLGLWQERLQRKQLLWLRKIGFLCSCLEKLSVHAFTQVLEQLYQHSKRYQSFALLFALLERAVERFAGQPGKLFQLWAKDSSARYYVHDYQRGYESSLRALQYRDYADEAAYSQVLVRHGNLCLQLKKYKEALFSYLQGYHLRANADESFALACKVNSGRAYFKLCDYENARKQWEEVLAKAAANDELRIHLLTDLTFLELTRGDFAKGMNLYCETERMLSRLPQQKKEAYASEALLHERNGALIRYVTQPEQGMKQLLATACKMTKSPLKDEIFETVYLMVVFLAKYGNILGEEDLRKLENLKEYIV